MTNQSAQGRAGVAPAIAPLPEMQCCARCHDLAVGSQRAGGNFVCAECWGYHIDTCPVEHTQDPEPAPMPFPAEKDTPAQERGWLSCPVCRKRLALIEGPDREQGWPCPACLARDGALPEGAALAPWYRAVLRVARSEDEPS